MMVDTRDFFERKGNHADRLTSLYGLTPKVEMAIREALKAGAVRRVRVLIAPLHPADQADLLERMPVAAAIAVVLLLDDQLDAETLTYVDESRREAIIDAIGPDGLARQLQDLSTDDAVNIVEELEQSDLRNVLAAMSAEDRVLVQEGLSFPKDSAGRLMQRELVTVPSFWTVSQTFDFLRSGKSTIENFYLIFVIDPLRKPLGEIALSRLLCAEGTRRVSELMDTEFRSIPVDMDQEEVAVLFRRYGMVSVGVVDQYNRLVGTITNDDVINVIDEEAEEDLLALAGVGDTNLRSGLWEILQGRSSWLFINLLTAVIASAVIAVFEATIEQLIALAVLMPIVASMGGNAGTQTMTVAVRAIALRQLDAPATRQFVIRELIVALANGLLFAALAAGLSYFWFGDLEVALVMAVAMMANLLVAGLSGAFVPIGMKRAGIDPAAASSIFVTTITDVVGFFVFLGLAAFYLM